MGARKHRARIGLQPGAAAVIQFLNIVRVFFDREAGPYLAGLLALLAVAAVQVAFLVIAPMTAAASGRSAAQRSVEIGA